VKVALPEILTRFKIRLARGFSHLEALYPRETELEISVEKGLHAGSLIAVSATSFTIGGEEDDILLFDSCFVARQIAVTVQALYPFPLVTLEAEEGWFETSGAPSSAPYNTGRKDHLLPVSLSNDEMSFTISRAARERPFRERAALSAIALALFLLIFAMLIPRQGAGLLEPAPRFEEAHAEAQQISPQSRLQQLLESAGFEDDLVVTISGPDTIEISGWIQLSQVTAWEELHLNLDSIFPMKTIITRVATHPGLANVPGISVVSLGDNPRLILIDGRELEIGDRLVGEWVIDEITPTHIGVTGYGSAKRILLGE
jgi:hypothetical protein